MTRQKEQSLPTHHHPQIAPPNTRVSNLPVPIPHVFLILGRRNDGDKEDSRSLYIIIHAQLPTRPILSLSCLPLPISHVFLISGRWSDGGQGRQPVPPHHHQQAAQLPTPPPPRRLLPCLPLPRSHVFLISGRWSDRGQGRQPLPSHHHTQAAQLPARAAAPPPQRQVYLRWPHPVHGGQTAALQGADQGAAAEDADDRAATGHSGGLHRQDEHTGPRQARTWQVEYFFLKRMSAFFLGSWGMNRSAWQTNCVNRESALDSFPISPEKCFQQRPCLEFSEKSCTLKFPTLTGT